MRKPWCGTDDAITIPTKMGVPVVYAWVKQGNLMASIRVNAFKAVRLVQIAARTCPGQIVELRLSPTRLWNDMLDVECGSLQRLVHMAIFTTACGSVLHMQDDVSSRHHCGARPSNWRAVARTSASVSLSSTSASNSARSASVKSPSVLRSMSCCKRVSARGGKRRALTDSTHANGAATVVPIADAPSQAKLTESVRKTCPLLYRTPRSRSGQIGHPLAVGEKNTRLCPFGTTFFRQGCLERAGRDVVPPLQAVLLCHSRSLLRCVLVRLLVYAELPEYKGKLQREIGNHFAQWPPTSMSRFGVIEQHNRPAGCSR